MEVSALRYSGGIGLHARSPLLRLQSDERLVTLIRRGSTAAFEVLVARYHARLLAFCRHLLGSREDAEDVLQEVFSAAFNAILDDDRPINVRPWLYRIARNRSLNHLRRIQAVGVDSMDIHLSEHGATTADKVHEREEFRMLVGDIQGLPETQRTALVLREMDALSYEQIAEAMETTVPSVKSLLVRARVSLAEAAEARLLTCEQVRIELAEVAEGLQRRPGALVRRHLRACDRCSTFKGQLNETSKQLAAALPIGGFFLLRKLAILHIGHSAGAGAGSSASGASAAGQAAAVGGTAAAGAGAVMGSTTTGFLSASIGAIATKAAAGLAAAALVTAGAVEVEQPARPHVHHQSASNVTRVASVPSPPATVASPRPSATPSGGAALGAIRASQRGEPCPQGQGQRHHSAQAGGQDGRQARHRHDQGGHEDQDDPGGSAGADADPDRLDGAERIDYRYDHPDDRNDVLSGDKLGQHDGGYGSCSDDHESEHRHAHDQPSHRLDEHRHERGDHESGDHHSGQQRRCRGRALRRRFHPHEHDRHPEYHHHEHDHEPQHNHHHEHNHHEHDHHHGLGGWNRAECGTDLDRGICIGRHRGRSARGPRYQAPPHKLPA